MKYYALLSFKLGRKSDRYTTHKDHSPMSRSVAQRLANFIRKKYKGKVYVSLEKSRREWYKYYVRVTYKGRKTIRSVGG